MNSDSRTPVLLAALAAVAQASPYERKLLVCRRHGEGRELLRALAASGTPWIGYEVTTLWQLAQSMVGEKLAERQLKLIDEFDQAALLDEAIDAAFASGGEGRLAELAEGMGLRQAVAATVQALRLGGVDAAALGRTRLRDEQKRGQLARLLAGYETLLQKRGLIDVAGTFRAAVASLRVGDIALPAARICLLPGLSRRGLSGQLLDALVERGAVVLPSERVHGLDTPVSWLAGSEATSSPAGSRLGWLHAVREAPGGPAGELELFAATSVTAELKEVLRRVLAAGGRWDEVEIVATEPLSYGVALDDLARRLEIPVTYAAGLPVSRTRPGRALAKYLEWLAQGFPADVLRGLFERGDIAPSGMEGSGPWLARELRRLKVGRGRDRYAAALARARRALERAPAPEDERSPQEVAEDRARRGTALDALAAVLEPVLAATPDVPDRVSLHEQRVAPADIARGALTLLRFVPRASEVEHTAHARLTQRLERVERTATRAVPLPAAIALLLSRIDTRVPSPDASGASPWSAAGGHVHFSDVEHGGYTQRRFTFIVGVDAVRFPGSGMQDALLVDDDRRRITVEQTVPALPTAADRIEEKKYAFAALLARLRGRVTLSYSTWDAVEGRAVPPAAELLQAYRLMSGNAAADYEALHEALAPAASAVPRSGACLDAADVWLAALSDGQTLLRGVDVVRGVYPGIDAGFIAGRSLQGDALTPHHGVIAPRKRLDPRQNTEMIVSASQLQTLGTCPQRYLLKYVLRVRPPEDPELSPEQWLGPLERGALMHRVYERTLTAAHERDIAVEDGAFEALALGVLEQELAAMRAELPPPGEAIYELEADGMREDTRAFVAMVREDGARWLLPLERKFGWSGTPSVDVPLPHGSIRVIGAIDRIDRLPDGRLVIIDYKTGSSLRFGEKQGAYDGGRRLQHVLYAAVAQRLENADVARAEYHFPTRRAENHRAKYDAAALRQGLSVIDKLLMLVERGMFHPTNDPDDCRFCDYAAACRVRVNEYGEVKAPIAEWVRAARLEELELLRELRR